MSQLTSRLYTPDDLESILDLLRRSRTEKRSSEFPTPADLAELLSQPDVQVDTRIWVEPTDSPAAFALVDPYNNLLFEIAPHTSTPDLEMEILLWGRSRIAQRVKPGRPYPTLDASCLDSDRGRIAWLERNGFVRQAAQTLHLERDLTGSLPAPALPEGFKLRSLQIETELDDWIELHQVAHGTGFMTRQAREAMMAHPGYDPMLDLVVEAPDGRLAAYCICTIDTEENQTTGRKVGMTDPIATHPDYQRRGLAFALLLAGMQLLRAHGMEFASLTTTSTNMPMLAAASKAGYRIVSKRFWYAHRCSGPLKLH